MKYFIISTFFLFFCITNTMWSQPRQSDSMRKVQENYWKQLKIKEQKAKEQAAIDKRNAASTVITYDTKGNKIETKSQNGTKTITKTISVSPPIMNRPFNADTINKDSVYIKVFKSKNRIQVYHKGVAFTAFKCVFGPNNVGQKLQEGDRKTPEGIFTIKEMKKHDKWDIFMLLDYPNETSMQLFEEAKIKGLVSPNARIGGAIGIHGIWHNGDNVIDLKHNWTDGCVSLKNKDIELLAQLIKPGITQVAIFK